MSNKITIELTEAQLSNLNSIISIAGLAHQNPVLVRSTLPEKLQVDGSYAVPNEIDVDYLITKGSIGDRGAYGSDAFIRMFERVAKKHPVVAKEYIEKLFLYKTMSCEFFFVNFEHAQNCTKPAQIMPHSRGYMSSSKTGIGPRRGRFELIRRGTLKRANTLRRETHA